MKDTDVAVSPNPGLEADPNGNNGDNNNSESGNNDGTGNDYKQPGTQVPPDNLPLPGTGTNGKPVK